MAHLHEDAITCETGTARPRAVLLVLVIGTFLAPLDSSIVNIALPAISGEFGVGLSSVGWVTSAYLLTSASLLLSMGRVGDVWGLRSLYVRGLLLFGVGSLACALAGGLPALVASRVLQAVGASMLFAAGPALVSRTFPPGRRGWALGYVSLAVSAGLTAGPALGGFLVGTFGWPSIFLINVPLAGIVAFIAWRLLPDECPQGGSFDMPGAVLAAGALLLLLIGLSRVEASGLLSLEVLGALAGALAFSVAFVSRERRAATPMVDLRLFRNREFSVGILAATIAYLALFAMTFTMPFFLVRVMGLAERAAGAVLTVTPLVMAVFAPQAGRLSDRIGGRVLTTVGLAGLSTGLLWLSFVGGMMEVWFVVVGLMLIGGGMAVFQTPNTASVLQATPHAHVGVGSAFIAEARNVGMAIGVAVTAAIVGSMVGGVGLPGGSDRVAPAMAMAFLGGMAVALRTASALAAGAAVLAWFGHTATPVERAAVKP